MHIKGEANKSPPKEVLHADPEGCSVLTWCQRSAPTTTVSLFRFTPRHGCPGVALGLNHNRNICSGPSSRPQLQMRSERSCRTSYSLMCDCKRYWTAASAISTNHYVASIT